MIQTSTRTEQKGFTLIELLIVIGILAILTAAVVIILNPGELLKQARDSQRFSDLDALKNTIALYLTDSQPFTAVSSTACYVSTATTVSAYCGGDFATSTRATATQTGNRSVNGSGWIPLNFTAITSGSPLQNLPVDPVNNATYFYAAAFDPTNLTFELDANLESAKYSSKETTDGGNNAAAYEVGSAPGLAL